MLAWQADAVSIWTVLWMSVWTGGTPVIAVVEGHRPMYGVAMMEAE